VGEEVHNCIHVFAGRLGCEIIELNVQPDHVHLLVKIIPKVSISEFMGAKMISQIISRGCFAVHARLIGEMKHSILIILIEKKERPGKPWPLFIQPSGYSTFTFCCFFNL